MSRVDVKFTKVREGAKIPSKRDFDAGLDIYACFEEDYLIIDPQQTEMITSGIKGYAGEEWWFAFKERGSTGTKGIGQRAGVVEGVYTGEWIVPVTNHNDVPLVISKADKVDNFQLYNSLYNELFYGFSFEDIIFYPYEKAICQAVLLPVFKLDIEEVEEEEFMSYKSERGEGKLGSSGK